MFFEVLDPPGSPVFPVLFGGGAPLWLEVPLIVEVGEDGRPFG